MYRFIIAIIILLSTVGNTFAQQYNIYSTISKGNRAFLKDDFVQAEVLYKKALELDAENLQAKYNLANAVYKQERFDEALELYKLTSENFQSKKDKANAYHNLGNVHLSKKEYEKSIEAFKKALKLNPTDEETRYNLAYAQKHLQKEEDESEDKKNDENKDEENEDKEDENKEENNDEGNDDDEKNNENSDEEEKNDQKQQPQPNQLTKEQAEQLLRALAAEEEKLQNDKQEKTPVQISTGKDW
jgi:Ca-activated chloride channel family protein